MAILALDISSARTGWALHRPGMERPHFGSIAFPSDPDEVGKLVEGMRVFLGAKHEAFGLTDIVVEKQHLGMVSVTTKGEDGKKQTERRPINPRTLEVLYGLTTMVDWFAYRVKPRIRSRCIPIQTHRKHFIGRGDYGKVEAKQRALDVCRALDWHVPNEDAAEACSILDCYLSLIKDYERPWRDVLMMAGVRT